MPNSIKKILIVEDNLINRFMLQKHLKSIGYQVKTANNGVEAIDLIKTSAPPHIIVSDLQMPYLDGYQLLIELRENKNTAHIPIIAVSSFDLITEYNLKGHRFDQFIHKPFSLEYLTSEIKRLIEINSFLRTHSKNKSFPTIDLESKK